MKLSLVLLVLTATVVAGHPYSPYTDSRDGVTKNTQLTDEDIAAYLRSKMITDELELANIVEYVESLIQGGSKHERCRSNTYKLETIRDTIIGNASDDSTYITPDHFATIYPDEGQSLITSYDIMLKDNVTEIWTNHAPCPVCVGSLIARYKKSRSKPTIHIAKLFNVSGSQDNTLTLLYLLKLARNNFTITGWNMEDLHNMKGDCATLIHNYSNDKDFMAALSDTEKYIEDAKDVYSRCN